jgi:alpha-L-rhamnosidase
MNSFNHYAYGAIGDWMYREIAGLDTDESGPGYKKSIIAPHPGGNLKFVSAVLQTLYGPLRSEWNIENGFLKLDITIPNNTTAIVNLPAAASAVIKESGNPIEKVKEISDISKDGNDLNFNLGSGTYHFEYSMGKN